jgi:hypothetical protein
VRTTIVSLPLLVRTSVQPSARVRVDAARHVVVWLYVTETFQTCSRVAEVAVAAGTTEVKAGSTASTAPNRLASISDPSWPAWPQSSAVSARNL